MEENNIQSTEETVENQQVVLQNDSKNKKKGSKKNLFIIIGIVVVLAVAIYFVYTKFFSTKSIFIKSVNKEYAKFEKILDSTIVDNKDAKPILMTGDFDIDLEIDDDLLPDEDSKKMVSEINKLGFEYEFGMDESNKEAKVVLDALYDNQDLLNIGGYLKDDTLYLELKDLYDKYIEIPFDEIDSYDMGSTMDMVNSMNLQDISKDDLKYFLSKTKDILLNNLNEKDFKKSKETVKIDGKDVKTTKITYNFSQKNAYELLKKSLNSIKKDSKYIKIIAKLSDTDEKELKDGIDSISAMLGMVDTKDLDKTTVMKLSVFAKGISGIEVSVVDEESSSYVISYYKKDDTNVIKASENGKEIFNITFDVEEKGNKITYDYTIESEDSKMTGKVTEEKIKENKDGTGEVKITSETSMMGLVKVTITSNLKTEYTDKLKLPNTSNSINYEDISESDIEKIELKLLQNKVLVSLIENFEM